MQSRFLLLFILSFFLVSCGGTTPSNPVIKTPSVKESLPIIIATGSATGSVQEKIVHPFDPTTPRTTRFPSSHTGVSISVSTNGPGGR